MPIVSGSHSVLPKMNSGGGGKVKKKGDIGKEEEGLSCYSCSSDPWIHGTCGTLRQKLWTYPKSLEERTWSKKQRKKEDAQKEEE